MAAILAGGEPERLQFFKNLCRDSFLAQVEGWIHDVMFGLVLFAIHVVRNIC